MTDIAIILKTISEKEKCSALDAFLILLDKNQEDEKDVRILQPESDKQPCR